MLGCRAAPDRAAPACVQHTSRLSTADRIVAGGRAREVSADAALVEGKLSGHRRQEVWCLPGHDRTVACAPDPSSGTRMIGPRSRLTRMQREHNRGADVLTRAPNCAGHGRGLGSAATLPVLRRRRPRGGHLHGLSPGSPRATVRRAARSARICRRQPRPAASAWRTRPSFSRISVAVSYRFPVDGAIQRLKYGNDLSLAEPLAALLAERVAREPTPDLVVPMPMASLRLRERGFNQALEIARGLSERLDLKLATEVCRRTRHTPPQASLPLGGEAREHPWRLRMRRRLDRRPRRSGGRCADHRRDDERAGSHVAAEPAQPRWRAGWWQERKGHDAPAAQAETAPPSLQLAQLLIHKGRELGIQATQLARPSKGGTRFFGPVICTQLTPRPMSHSGLRGASRAAAS